jgi:hypothetical protein
MEGFMTHLPTDSAARKDVPLASGCLDYFPDALAEVARLSQIGNDKHNPGEPLHWSRHKSNDHADCILRHMLERGTVDTDGLLHDVKVAWRALAMLQVALEKRRAITAMVADAVDAYEPGAPAITDHDMVRASVGRASVGTSWMSMHSFDQADMNESALLVDLMDHDGCVIPSMRASTITHPSRFASWRFS